MPIGFWAISRNDLKELWAFQKGQYPLTTPDYTEHDLDMLIIELMDDLEGILDQDLRVQIDHRRIQNKK